MPGTEMPKGVACLAESIRAVDDRHQLAGFEAFVRYGRSRFCRRPMSRTASCVVTPIHQPTMATRSSRAIFGPPTVAYLPRGFSERGIECRARGLRIENQVVAPSVSGEVFLRVVDDEVETETPHHFQFCGAVNSSDLDVLQFRQLDGDCTTPPPAPLIKIRWPARSGPFAKGLARRAGRLGAARPLARRSYVRVSRQGAFGRTDILRKAAPAPNAERRQIAVDLVSHAKTLNAAAHCGNPPGDVGTENTLSWRTEGEWKRRALEDTPIPIVD